MQQKSGESSTFFFLLAPTNTVDFRSPVTTTDLNRFIDDNLQPTDEFNREMNRSVDRICSFLREHLSPREIVKVYSIIYVQTFYGPGRNKKMADDLQLEHYAFCFFYNTKTHSEVYIHH